MMTEQERAELTEIIESAIEKHAAPLMMRYAQEIVEAVRLNPDDAVVIAEIAEREACALMVERLGAEGYGTLAIAAMIRKGGE
jgi:hypothetical protein